MKAISDRRRAVGMTLTRWWCKGARGLMAPVVVLGLAIAGGVSAQTVRYIHTDALGTPIVVTDVNRNVIERSEYAPYGELLNRPVTDGPGYTGHVQDAATGLTYMQQRYYDPMCGCFLSVDPVTAYSNGDWRFFNRYAYAFNNPYKFTDPDGRESACISSGGNCGMGPGTGQRIMRVAPVVADFTPGIGDVKGFVDAYNDPSPANIAAAIVGLAGPVGDGAAKLIKGADKVADVAKGGADFVVTPDGAVIPTSQSRMVSGLEAAGMKGATLPGGKGTSHTLPNGTTVRAMEPSGQAPRRASFNNANGGPVMPGGKVPQPPRGSTPQERRNFVRDRTHVEQEP